MPVHFVITKWDLLQKERYSLKNVRENLLKMEHFKNIVNQLKELETLTRLIPVSALGSEFAELTPKGIMKKIPNKMPKPFQVEMPLACILIDKFQIIQKQIAAEPNSIKFLLKRLWIQFILLFTELIKWLPLSDVMVIGIVLELVKKSLERNEERLKEKTSLEAIKNRVDAIESVVASYERLILELEKQFPESKLYQI